MDDLKTNKKITIITGASKGLGRAIFEELRLNARCWLAVFSRSQDAYEDKSSLGFKGDITNINDIRTFVEKVIGKWGKIDILINNAGIVNLKPFLKYTDEDYEEIFKTNVKGSFLMAQEVIKHMLEEGQGYIINIGSTRSITGAPEKSLYSMSKFALRSLTQCINSEFKHRGVYSTIVCPGALNINDGQGKVRTADVAQMIKGLIELPISGHVPEVIIGGQL